MEKDRRNIYTCDECFGQIVTLDVDEGVTPMFLRCRATPKCEGNMSSAMYPKRLPIKYKPTYEWYKPTGKAFKKLNSGMKDHVERGGLDLRPILKKNYDEWDMWLLDTILSGND